MNDRQEVPGRSVARPELSLAATYGTLAVAMLGGLSTFLTRFLFIEAYTPRVTRARKRELIDSVLRLAVPLFAFAAAVGFGLAVWRHKSVAKALWVRTQERLSGVLVGIAAGAALIALSTPLFQRLCGLEPDLGWSRIVETTDRLSIGVFAVMGAALQEDILVRWLPIELLALLFGVSLHRSMHRPSGIRRIPDARTGAILLASVILAVALHAIQSGDPYTWNTWVRYGLPKAPGAAAFAWMYWQYGAAPALLLHALTNLFVLLVLPLLAGA